MDLIAFLLGAVEFCRATVCSAAADTRLGPRLVSQGAYGNDQRTMNANLTCLVLGGCGFIGLNLVEKLLDEGYSVRVFDRPDANRPRLQAGIDFRGGDFLNDVELDRALEGVDFVFHISWDNAPGQFE